MMQNEGPGYCRSKLRQNPLGKSLPSSNKMGLWCAMWLLYGMAQLRISTTFQFYAATLIILVRLCPKDPHGTKKQWQIPLQHRRRRNTEHSYQQSLYSISFVFLLELAPNQLAKVVVILDPLSLLSKLCSSCLFFFQVFHRKHLIKPICRERHVKGLSS